jgi:hypothetical protein
MDAIKETIARHVQKHALGHVQELTEALGMPDASDVEISPISLLQTQIRVRTPNAGTRYFTLQLRERY